jgi:transcriptional regulator with XRE-family HTH domain
MLLAAQPEMLASFLRTWRGERPIAEVVRESGLSAYSVWYRLEAGQAPSLETLIRLADYTGRPIEELAAKAGMPVRKSMSDRDRAVRVAAMERAIPRMAVLVDLLAELTPAEVDTLLTVAEAMLHRRRAP